MSTYNLARLSAVLNIVGSILLFFSFQATSTKFLIVPTNDGRTALCVGSEAMFVVKPGGGIGIGTKCPDSDKGKPAAVVNTECPVLAVIGFLMILGGFITQYKSIEKPAANRAERRRGESPH